MERLIFHIDVNSAFLSWESVKRLSEGGDDLRIIPAIVGGDPEKRTGIVLAKSILAKKYGVTTGEPVSMALRKCPGLVIAKPDFRLYDRCSKAFKAICREYAPAMESFSIDEVFIDMTGTRRIYPDPIKTAYEIKNRIRDELGFTVNVGIGRNKLCAKMASDFEKPDKVHTLFPEEIPEKMWPLPAGELFLLGKASAAKLENAGIYTIGDIARKKSEEIQLLVGDKHGKQIHDYANGIDDSIVKDVPDDAKGYSVETTIEEDLTDLESIDRFLLAQADQVGARIRADNVRCRCIAVKYRTISFSNKIHQRKLATPTDVTSEIYKVARELIRESWKGQPLRLIGLGVSDVEGGEYEQLSFVTDPRREKLKKLDAAVDSIRDKFGNSSLMLAGTMGHTSRVGRKYQAQHENRVDEDKQEPDSSNQS